MSKLLKMISAFLACCFITVSAFASSLTWSRYVNSHGIELKDSLNIETSQNSRSFIATMVTSKNVGHIVTSVTVARVSDTTIIGTDTWNTSGEAECEAFYPVSYSGIPENLKAKGYFYATNGNDLLENYESSYYVYE